MALTFQGGFVGLQCSIYAKRVNGDEDSGSDSWILIGNIFPEDVNRPQTFTVSNTGGPKEEALYNQLRLVFEQSSDFFGRIVVYNLSIDGDVAEYDI